MLIELNGFALLDSNSGILTSKRVIDRRRLLTVIYAGAPPKCSDAEIAAMIDEEEQFALENKPSFPHSGAI